MDYLAPIFTQSFNLLQEILKLPWYYECNQIKTQKCLSVGPETVEKEKGVKHYGWYDGWSRVWYRLWPDWTTDQCSDNRWNCGTGHLGRAAVWFKWRRFQFVRTAALLRGNAS